LSPNAPGSRSPAPGRAAQLIQVVDLSMLQAGQTGFSEDVGNTDERSTLLYLDATEQWQEGIPEHGFAGDDGGVGPIRNPRFSY
jgi:hypothetical protein